jgi:hypothetical protein
MACRLQNGMTIGLPKGIILSKRIQVPIEPWEHVTYNDNVLIAGASGSGKTESVVKPNVMQCDRNFCIIDVKRNLHDELAPGLRSVRYSVHQIDFTSPETSESSWNLFFDQSERSVNKVIEGLIKSFASGSDDKYWISAATRTAKAFASGLRAMGERVTIKGLIRMLKLACRNMQKSNGLGGDCTAGVGTEYDQLLAKTLGVNLKDEFDERASGPQRLMRFRDTDDTAFKNSPEGRKLYEAKADAEKALLRAKSEESSRSKAPSILLPDGSTAKCGPTIQELEAAYEKASKAYEDAHWRYRPTAEEEEQEKKELAEEEARRKDAMARDSQAWREWETVRTLPAKTYACIMDTMASCFDKITPAMAEMLSRNDAIDLSSLGDRPTALFVKVSDTCGDMERALVSLFESDVIGSLCRRADSMDDGRLEYPVQIILDDFTSGPMIPDLVETIATVRSRGIGLMLLTQSVSQILETYGTYATSILSNCDMQVFLDVRGDYSTRTYLKHRPEVTSDMFPPGPGREVVIVNDHAWVDDRFDPNLHPNAKVFLRERDNSRGDEMQL